MRRQSQGQVVSKSGGAAPEAGRFTGWRKWVLRLFLLAAAPALVLGLLEGGLRLAGCGYPTDFLVSSDGGRTWTPNLQFCWTYMGRTLATEPDLFVLAGAKPPGTCRIFILGESAAMGTPDPSFGVGRVLEVMLRERYPAARFEVVNAAMMGISSHAVRAIARDCARRDPDVFIVYMGNNDIVGPWTPFTMPRGLPSNLAAVRASLWAKSTRVGQLLASALGRFGPPEPSEETIEGFLSHAIAPDEPRLAVAVSHFRANLADICRTGRDAGARVVVSTVATNLADCAPLASVHREGMGGPERARWDTLVREGETEESLGRPAAALARYREALAIDDRFADLHFRLGRCLLAAGRAEEARRHCRLARDLDALPFRATSPLNEAVREAAGGREAEGVYLVDGERALEACEDSRAGIPGEALFYEHAHMTFEGNYRLAQALLPAVERALPAAVRRGAAAAAAPSCEQCAERLALTPRDRLRMAASVLSAVSRPPFTNQSDYAWRIDRQRRAFEELGRREAAAGRVGQMAIYWAAMARSPDDWLLDRNFALLAHDYGDFGAAAEHWRKVLAAIPFHVEARVRLGDALAQAGQVDEAVAEYEAAIYLRPECVLARQQLAAAHLARGRTAEAAEVMRQALKIRQDPFAYCHLGMILANAGRTDEAIDVWRRGVAQFPGDAELHGALAQALLTRDEFQEAAEHFEAVLRAEPDHVRARCGLARALARLGKTDEAATHYRVAVALSPSAAADTQDIPAMLSRSPAEPAGTPAAVSASASDR